MVMGWDGGNEKILVDSRRKFKLVAHATDSTCDDIWSIGTYKVR